MNKPVLIMATCVLGLAACSARVPTNEELTGLLHREGARAGDANAPLDAAAVMCLRTWSGDDALSANLPASARTDAAKGKCRARIDGWIAEKDRNPSALEFAEVSNPDVVRRAMALLATRGGGAAQTAMNTPAAAEPHPRAVEPAPDLDATLTEATNICQKARDMTANDKQNMRLYRFAEFCVKNLADTRAEVTRLKLEGNTAELDKIARRTQRMARTAERIAGQPAQ